MLSVYSVGVCALHCVSIDFVCMHLLLDQCFEDFLKFPKLKQFNPFAIYSAHLCFFGRPYITAIGYVKFISVEQTDHFAHFLKQRKTREIWNIW